MKSEVYNCDCLEYMKTLPDNYFELCIADPPYWSAEEQTGRIRTAGNKQSDICLGGKPSQEIFDEIVRVSKNQIIFGANNFDYTFKGFVVWEKTNIPENFTLSMAEIASLSEGISRTSKVFRCPSSKPGLHRIHPTQKPVELYVWLLNTYAKPGDKIFDPFVGGGSSRIAAYGLGFDFFGCEIDKKFFELMDARFKEECKGIVNINGREIIEQRLF